MKTHYNLLPFLLILALAFQFSPSNLIADPASCGPATTKPPCHPLISVFLKKESLQPILDAQLPAIQKALKENLVGKVLGNPTNASGEIQEASIPPLTSPDLTKCSNTDTWSNLSFVEKWKTCPGVPLRFTMTPDDHDAIIQHGIDNSKLKKVVSKLPWIGRTLTNVKEDFTPIPAIIDVKDVTLQDISLGHVRIDRLPPTNPAYDTYRLTVPVEKLQVGLGLQAKAVGFAENPEDPKLLDLRKVNLNYHSTMPGSKDTNKPLEVSIQFDIGRDGKIVHFQYDQTHQSGQLQIPLNNLFLAYNGLDRPVQGARFVDQKLTDDERARIRADFSKDRDVDNFTGLADFINNSKVATKIKSTAGTLLSNFIAKKVFPLVQQKTGELLQNYAHPGKPMVLDLSTRSVSFMLNGPKIENLSNAVREHEEKVMNSVSKVLSSVGNSDEFKTGFSELKSQLDEYRSDLKKLSKSLPQTSDRGSLSRLKSHLEALEFITEGSKEMLEQNKAAKKEDRAFSKTQHESMDSRLGKLSGLLETLKEVQQAVEQKVDDFVVQERLKVVAKNSNNLNHLLQVNVQSVPKKDQAEDCEEVEQSLSSDVKKDEDGTIKVSRDGINEKLKELFEKGFFNFCHNINEERDCLNYRKGDLKVDVQFAESPRLQWDPERKQTYIDLSGLKVTPKGPISLAKGLLPKESRVRIYTSLKGCEKDGKPSVCLDTELVGANRKKLPSTGIFGKVAKQMKSVIKFQPMLVDMAIKKLSPTVNRTIAEKSVGTGPVQFKRFEQHPDGLEISFKIH